MRLETVLLSLAQNSPLGGTDMPVLWGYSALPGGRPEHKHNQSTSKIKKSVVSPTRSGECS